MASEISRPGFWTFNSGHAAIIGVMVALLTPIGFYLKWSSDASIAIATELANHEQRLAALEHQADGSRGEITAWERTMTNKVDRIGEDVANIKGILSRQRGDLSPYAPPIREPKG